VLETLARHNNVAASGMGVDALRKAVAPYLPPEAFLSLIRELGFRRKVELANSIVQLSGHSGSFSAADEVLWQRVLPILIEGGAAPPLVERVAADLNVKEVALVELLHRKRKSGVVAAASPTLFYRASRSRDAGVRRARNGASQSGEFSAAQYRDALGTGRGRCHPHPGALRPDGCPRCAMATCAG
jgi:selenocysteine-specific elongation factor